MPSYLQQRADEVIELTVAAVHEFGVGLSRHFAALSNLVASGQQRTSSSSVTFSVSCYGLEKQKAPLNNTGASCSCGSSKSQTYPLATIGAFPLPTTDALPLPTGGGGGGGSMSAASAWPAFRV